MRKILLLIISYLFIALPMHSQEIDCRIQVNASQLQGTNKAVFESMQQALFEFVNNHVWTNHVYDINERIECNIQINIVNQISVDEFKGTLQISSSRPVYNTGYKTPMLNLLDKNVQFRYAEGQTLTFSETSHDELTSLVAYYIYLALGFDYDSFSSYGGSPFFEKAEKIVSTAQSSTYSGWKSYENKTNRYWLIENILNSVYSPIRDFSYTYHRNGMDLMSAKQADGRTNIANGLTNLLKVHRQKPSSYFMQVFWMAKSDEIVKLLAEANPSEKIRSANILKEVDPSNAPNYDKMTKSN